MFKGINMKYGLFFVLCLRLVGSFGQDYLDLGKFKYATTPNANFEEVPGSTRIKEWAMELNLPVVLGEKSTLLTGFFGNGTQLVLDPQLPEATALFVLGLNLGLHQRYGEVWNATYMIVPKIATDFHQGFKSGAQLGMLAMVAKTRSPRLKHTLGLFVNSEAYGPLIVPLLGLYYRGQDDRFEANLLLPIRVDLNYQLSKTSWIGINFDGIGTSYLIKNEIYNDSYVNKSSNELYSYLRYRITPSLLLDFKLGYAFFRSYRVFDKRDKVDFSVASIYIGNDRNQLNANFNDSAIFNIDLHYRLYFSPK
jgi:hypothetical protein